MHAVRMLTLLTTAFALVLTTQSLTAILPIENWLAAITAHLPRSSNELLFVQSALPRFVVAWLSGASLSLAGAVCQQTLRNPLAESTTLGTSAGAQAALLAALVWAPGLLAHGYGPIAIVGAALATVFVFGIAHGAATTPISTIMAGLIVNLTLGTVCAIIVLLHPDRSEELLHWQTGRLEQSGWSPALGLFASFALCAGAIAPMTRPLSLFNLSDDAVLSLGLTPSHVRTIALLIAIILSGAVVATVGVIGFIGLAVPAFVRLMGAGRLTDQLIWAPLLGGALLVCADQIVQWPAMGGGRLPTGTIASLLAAPVLLILIKRIRTGVSAAVNHPAHKRESKSWLTVPVFACGFIGLLAIALFVGRSPNGWELTVDVDLILRWRAARIVAAIAAGTLLGIAGMLIQKLTGNPLASPEVMGVSSGATFGAAVFIVAYGAITVIGLLAASTAGALLVVLVIVTLGWRRQFSPERLLLTGIALAAVVGALSAFLISTGGPVRALLLTWMSGSTYRVTADQAAVVAAIAIASLIVTPLLNRWLDILPLGERTALSLGVELRLARGTIVFACAIAAATATLVVGPASFVGLLAPQLVRQLGFQRALPQLLASALAGATIMFVADWLGRMLIFPWQIPAGLLTSLVGGPFFLFYLWKGQR